jgi:glycosyltransferase involved in cell wall biosynthesis
MPKKKLNMEKGLTASVVIPSYNSAATIEHTIEHLLKQSAIDRVREIIVVDSSDDDKTKDLLAKYAQGKVKMITSGVRVMPAIQRNIGARNAEGDILCFIDSDAYPAVDWIEKILEACEQGHKVGGGSYLLPDFQIHHRLAAAQYYLEFNEYINTGKPRNKKILPTCNLFCDRSLFEQVGGIPEIRASEDTLFGLKVSETENMIFLPDLKVSHIFRENLEHCLNNQKLIGKYIYVYRKYYYAPRYLRKSLIPILYPAMMLVKFLRIFYRILHAGPKHWRKFLWSAPLFFKGLAAWGKGFRQGSIEYEQLKGDFVL